MRLTAKTRRRLTFVYNAASARSVSLRYSPSRPLAAPDYSHHDRADGGSPYDIATAEDAHSRHPEPTSRGCSNPTETQRNGNSFSNSPNNFATYRLRAVASAVPMVLPKPSTPRSITWPVKRLKPPIFLSTSDVVIDRCASFCSTSRAISFTSSTNDGGLLAWSV